MRQTLLLSAIFFALSANAQDWKPMRSGLVYNFLLNGDMNSVRSLWIDSSESVNGEPVDFLNRVYVYPVTGITLSDGSECNPCALVNQPQFLLRSIRETSDGFVFEDGQNSFLIKTKAGLNESWTFDNNNRTATVTDISFGQVLNAGDSLKTITLSTGEKIVISREYGIVTFTIPGTTQKYEIAGIEGTGMGIRIPNAKSIFNFAVGDKFEYHGKRQGTTFETRNEYYNTIDQYTIKEKTVVNGFAQYLVEGVYQEGVELPYKYFKTISFDPDKRLNAYPFQVIDLKYGPHEGIDIKYDHDLKMYVRGLGTEIWPVLERLGTTDTFKKSPSIACGYSEHKFAPNLGPIFQRYIASGYIERKLVAHSGEVANFGTFTVFNLSTGPEIKEGPRIQLSSNPVSDKLTVAYETNSLSPVEMTLCNTAGVIVSRFSSSGISKSVEIDVSYLPAGMYFLTFSSEEGTCQEKVLVRR